MKPTPETHVFRSGSTVLTLVLSKIPSAIELDLHRSGPPLAEDSPDVPKFAAWLGSIVAWFDSDPRPVHIRRHDTGETADIQTLGGITATVVAKPN
jgi:hypothetical protein